MPDIDERFDRVDERFGKIEQRLDEVEKAVVDLRQEVGELRVEVGELRGEVGELRVEVSELRVEVGELRGEVGMLGQRVHRLQVLVESHDIQIRQIAEVQTHHGKQLEEIQKALKPLGELHDFVRLVASDHEKRISALEKRAGQ